MTTTRTLHLHLQAAQAIGNADALADAMTRLAHQHLQRGSAQIAADTLTFVLLQSGLSAPQRAAAQECLDELASRICPRVILDAQAFAADMDIDGMVDYLLDAATALN